jgi:flavodoxin
MMGKALIICAAVSHGNTRRVAEVMGEVLGAPVVEPEEVHGPMVRLLEDKGFEVTDRFSCRGFDTWAPFKPVGGIRKGRPDDTDFAAARAFTEKLKRGA